MSTQENPGALIQATLLGKKNGITSRFLLSKLKDIKQTQKSPQKDLLKNNIGSENNYNDENSTSKLASNSKKIQKQTKPTNPISRKVLEDLTNFYKNKANITPKNEEKKPVVQKEFKEDGVKELRKTKNYVSLTYINIRTRKQEQFYCFHDKDLQIPPSHSTRTIQHSCDNDCTTDEDQIRGAIRNLYKSVEACLIEQKKEKVETSSKIEVKA